MTAHRDWKRFAKRGGVSLAIVLALGWLALIASQWKFRKQAEALLNDIIALGLNRSSSVDAQKLIAHWDKWGERYGDCGKGDCTYRIELNHLSLFSPQFVLEEGPHIATRILEFIGIRSADVRAGFTIANGTVVGKDFGIDVPLPVSQWISPNGDFWLGSKDGSGYWPSLEVAFSENVSLQASTASQFAEHPNRGFVQRRIQLLANFTPEESVEEQSALMDFRFDCITRWRACSSRGELLPQAAKEFNNEIPPTHH